jgi:hypothetical protein
MPEDLVDLRKQGRFELLEALRYWERGDRVEATKHWDAAWVLWDKLDALMKKGLGDIR